MPAIAWDHFSFRTGAKQSWRVAGFPRRKLTLRPAIAPPCRGFFWPKAQFTEALLARGSRGGLGVIQFVKDGDHPLAALFGGPDRYVERYSATPSDFSRTSLRFCIHQPRSKEIGQIDLQAPKIAPFQVRRKL
jgi:hypothetical protein